MSEDRHERGCAAGIAPSARCQCVTTPDHPTEDALLADYDPVPGLVARGVMSDEHDPESCDLACCDPAEDARESRLSAGEVERLVRAADAAYYDIPRPDETTGAKYVRLLAPVVADLIAAAEQRGAEEVTARVEAGGLDSILADYVGPAIPHESIAIVLDMAETLIRRALGGTAGGRAGN